ncbi:MAG: ubiquinone oxidoreductase 20 kDa subunit [Firmicutes bacterium]|nr:ubiquinone oxidoreductase 20 kDa subunit [Bacillota bacterium]
MLKILRKIMMTGSVTQNYTENHLAPRARGEIAADGPCTECGACFRVCPTGALRLIEKEVSVDHCACIFCGRCVEVCQSGALRQTGNINLAELSGQLEQAGQSLKKRIMRTLGRSLAIRHLDVGSCNACEWELNALSNPLYDLQQYGLDFVASPRHADLLMVTGVVTRNLKQALLMTYEATPSPKLVMAVGACAASGRTYGTSYAIQGRVDEYIPVDIYVPGCPPRPQTLLYALSLVMDRIR